MIKAQDVRCEQSVIQGCTTRKQLMSAKVRERAKGRDLLMLFGSMLLRRSERASDRLMKKWVSDSVVGVSATLELFLNGEEEQTNQ